MNEFTDGLRNTAKQHTGTDAGSLLQQAADEIDRLNALFAPPSNEAMMAAVEMEIENAIGRIKTEGIGRLIQVAVRDIAAARDDYYERCQQWAKGNVKRELEACRDAMTIAELRSALEKIQKDSYSDADFQIRDCDQPEMVWQSVARRALAATPDETDAEQGGGE